MRPDPWSVALGVLGCVLGLAGCDQRHDRVEVIGLVVPVQEPAPAPGTTVQPLPPLPDLPIAPDTADGSVLVEVDQDRFFADRGTTLPAWAPSHPTQVERDPTLADLRQVVEDLRSVQRHLDALFDQEAAAAPSAVPGSTPGTPAGAPVPAPATAAAAPGAAAPHPAPAPVPAPRDRQAALLMSPADWSTLVAKIMRVTASIDHFAAQSREIGPDGTVVSPRDGDAIWTRRQNDLWRAMEPLTLQLLTDDRALARDGSLADVRRHPIHGPELEPLLTDILAAAVALGAAVHDRQAPDVVPDLRVLEHRIDALEAAPVSALAFGEPAPPEPPSTAEERNQSRLRLARLRTDLVAVAAQWAANGADQISPQPTPLLVYQRDAVVEATP